MLALTHHDDVTEVRFTSWRSRLSGMRVSAFIRRGVLIDSGFPTAAESVAQLAAARAIMGAVLTHYHEDHSGGAAALARRGIPLWMSDLTCPKVAQPAPIFFYRRFSWGSPEPVPAFTPFGLPSGLVAIATPGHSADHHVFWDDATRTVFGGDLFIGVKVRIAHDTEDARATSASLRRVIALGPRRFFDAHRGLLPNPVGLLTAKADWIDATIGEVERLIKDGLADAEIARRVLGSDRFGRWFTAGDYTMENWVRGIRRTVNSSPSQLP